MSENEREAKKLAKETLDKIGVDVSTLRADQVRIILNGQAGEGKSGQISKLSNRLIDLTIHWLPEIQHDLKRANEEVEERDEKWSRISVLLSASELAEADEAVRGLRTDMGKKVTRSDFVRAALRFAVNNKEGFLRTLLEMDEISEDRWSQAAKERLIPTKRSGSKDE